VSTTLKRISKWATELPFWEQAALEKIVTGVEFVEADYTELLQYLMEDAELVPKTASRPALAFPQWAEGDDAPNASSPMKLTKLHGLCNVNALVSNQVLTFGPALTVVYGANGSGKSGYARVIASAAFTRGDKQVLKDVTQPVDPAKLMTAKIELADGGPKPVTVDYEVGQPCPPMRSFYVFDSTSVHAHLTKSNPMSFSPAGLGYLTRLAEVTDQVRLRLQSQIDQRNRANPFTPLFSGNTEVSQLVAGLGAGTDLEDVRRLANLPNDELARLNSLDQEIAELKSQKMAEKIEELRQKIEDLQKLQTTLDLLSATLSDERSAEIGARIEEWQSHNAAAQSLSVGQFKTDYFSQTGTDAWQDFIQAAQALAKGESSPDKPYPQPESHCLLCHQPLSLESRELLFRLWAFLEGQAQSKLAEIETELNTRSRALTSLDLDFFTDQAVSYRHLQAQGDLILAKTEAYLAKCRERQSAMLDMARERQEKIILPFAESPAGELADFTKALSEEKQALENLDIDKQIAELEALKLELTHRQSLAGLLSQIEQFVADRQWAKHASESKVKRSTMHITKKYNELFSELVTQKYVDLFTDTLKKLKCPLRVKVQTKAQKGTTHKQIALLTDASVPADLAQPEKVLSEGEQRAVALADFLTEMALDEGSAGVVLDDPVTSLDFGWKEVVAEHLVREATGQRQVIVFTHDLHFLYCIKHRALAAKVSLETHWIEKRDDKPGHVFLNNSPDTEKDYKSSAIPQRIYKEAKEPSLPPEKQQRLLKDGFGALRTCYEAFVIFDLFAGSVQRFEERVAIESLRTVVIDRGIVNDVVDKVGLLSRYIEGHLHSDPYIAEKPTPDMLLQEIKDYDEIKKRHSDFKKAQGIK